MSKMQRGEVIHMKKFDGGRRTPDEMHRQEAYGPKAKCAMCKGKPAIRIRVLMQLAELVARSPEYVAGIVASNPEGPFVPTIPTTYGPMVKVSDVFFCDICKTDGEKEAAKGPSWAIVEIDRQGLGKTFAPMVQSLGVKG
jgi:hypothetical protein